MSTALLTGWILSFDRVVTDITCHSSKTWSGHRRCSDIRIETNVGPTDEKYVILSLS